MARHAKPTRRRVRRPVALVAFDALSIEGGLLQPDLVALIAAAGANEQSESDYGLDPKERVRDVIQTKFTLAQSLYARYTGSDQGPQATRRFISNLITQVFEFADLVETPTVTIADRDFPIGHQALGGRVPIITAPTGKMEDPVPLFGDSVRRRSAAQILQEYLNAADAALWGIVCDATRLRLYRDNAALTRPAYIEADLARMFDADTPRLSDFSALWLLIHASRFGKPGTPTSECALERWRDEGKKQGATARERLRDGVEAALLEFGRGFLEHPHNSALQAELRSGRLTPLDYLQALLRLAYRFIFVFTAEDRDVLYLPPPEDTAEYERWRRAKTICTRGYGLVRLRDRATKRQSRDRHGDAWEGIKILFHALARGEKRFALPALGGLFGPNGARELHDCTLSNERLYEAIFRLAWIRTDAGLERVNWRDMETEELGSVYESLLELSPWIGGQSGFEFVEAKGNERKTSASYYTPDSLVQALLDESLDPLIDETAKGKPANDAIEALLSLRIIDPACGSGHFLLAAARRLATRIVQIKSPGAPSLADFRHWLREVARRCLYGVDRNPMAVDLAKVALWIETVEPGKPLTFLDAHIRCGDSLLGIYDLAALQQGIPDEAYKPLTGDGKDAARAWAQRNRAERDARAKGQLALSEPPRAFRDAALAIEAKDENDLSDVEAKARAFRAMLAGPERYALEVACDLYMAAFLLPKTAPPGRHAGEVQSFVPTSRDVWDKLSGGRSLGLTEARAVDATKEARVFHWPVEFPQVFFPPPNKRPGFDLAIGNPPWERVKLQEKEFFATRAPEIATARNKAERQRLIEIFKSAPQGSPNRRTYEAFAIAKHVADAASAFARTPRESGGRFPLTGTGDINTYALFAELFGTVSAHVGVIVPMGIATDATTSNFFQDLIFRSKLSALVSFFEIRQFFTGTDDRSPFCLLALAANVARPRFLAQLTSTTQIKECERQYALTADEIATINPNTRTAPIFRSQADSKLTREIYSRVPILIEKAKGTAGNPWCIELGTMLHMSNDSGLFRTAHQLINSGGRRSGSDWEIPANSADPDVAPGRWVSVYEAKMIHQFDHRWGTFEHASDATAAEEARDVLEEEKTNPAFEVTPRYWIAQAEAETRLNLKGWTREWLVGWRRNARTGDERTWLMDIFPRSGVGDSVFLSFLQSDHEPRFATALLCLANSIPVDYVVRQKIGGTNLSFYFVEQFPMPSPSMLKESDFTFFERRALELTYTSNSMRPFAQDLGYTGPPFAWCEDRRALLRAELDARAALIYGLSRDQLRYVLDPEDVMGGGYPSETFRVLKKNDIARFGEYRTARLVLDAWDRLSDGRLT